ncbi:MAG: DUF4956 domain-containing protein, partial [Bacillota bacterium]
IKMYFWGIAMLSRFFSTTETIVPLDILINVVLAGFMSFLIYLIYIRFGTALSNRKQFGSSFLLITICTTLIIALIRSSVALSLGLVGALSIIRFRTAIKEPQELTYIFLCIAIGLGFGANERLITLSAGGLILLIIVVKGFIENRKADETYNLSVRTQKMELDRVVSAVGAHCRRINLRRFDQKNDMLNVLLFVEFAKYEQLKACINELKINDQDVEINFISNRSID